MTPQGPLAKRIAARRNIETGGVPAKTGTAGVTGGLPASGLASRRPSPPKWLERLQAKDLTAA